MLIGECPLSLESRRSDITTKLTCGDEAQWNSGQVQRFVSCNVSHQSINCGFVALYKVIVPNIVGTSSTTDTF